MAKKMSVEKMKIKRDNLKQLVCTYQDCIYAMLTQIQEWDKLIEEEENAISIHTN